VAFGSKAAVACIAGVCLSALAFTAPTARAQNAATPLIDAPTPSEQATGTISGTVTDTDGGLVSGAEVILTADGAKKPMKMLSRADGSFSFEHVAAGPFRLTAIAQGMALGEVSGTLAAGGIYLAQPIKLRVGMTTTELTVSPQTEHEIAQQQVQQEEKQRVLGFFPNFFVAYDTNTVPLDTKQKFNLAFHEVFDPTSFMISGAIAGVEQAANLFPGYGSGPAAFGKRYGAALADNTSSTMFSDAIYPSLFHQDPRYYYLGTGTRWHRTKYALETAVICKGDNGRWQTNYSQILGSLSAGALANAYYAPSDRHGATLTIENGLLSVAGAGLAHLFQEFVLRDYTSHVPPGTP
jgi:hypothetical protein